MLSHGKPQPNLRHLSFVAGVFTCTCCAKCFLNTVDMEVIHSFFVHKYLDQISSYSFNTVTANILQNFSRFEQEYGESKTLAMFDKYEFRALCLINKMVKS